MKKLIFTTLLMVCSMPVTWAQKPAQIKFAKTTHNFGSFSEKEPKMTYTFTFTNEGEQPLVINQVIASCKCTIPEYSKDPILPGGTGEIKVTYNGSEQIPGHFKKFIIVRSNGAVDKTRLSIEGDMMEAK